MVAHGQLSPWEGTFHWLDAETAEARELKNEHREQQQGSRLFDCVAEPSCESMLRLASSPSTSAAVRPEVRRALRQQPQQANSCPSLPTKKTLVVVGAISTGRFLQLVLTIPLRRGCAEVVDAGFDNADEHNGRNDDSDGDGGGDDGRIDSAAPTLASPAVGDDFFLCRTGVGTVAAASAPLLVTVARALPEDGRFAFAVGTAGFLAWCPLLLLPSARLPPPPPTAVVSRPLAGKAEEAAVADGGNDADGGPALFFADETCLVCSISRLEFRYALYGAILGVTFMFFGGV